MINLELNWQEAAVGTGCLAAAAAALLRCSRAIGPAEPAGPATRDSASEATRLRLARAGTFAREAALVLGLFALWQLAGSYSVLGPGGALGRARWIWQAERAVHLPSEASLQQVVLPHPLLVQALNLYYLSLHFPVLIACMVWLFVRHRERYPAFRTTLVVFTGSCLLIALIPVAPPRMLPGIGMVDTAVQYGQSVYSSQAGFNPDQLSAMPSVHVGWAILVAIAIISMLRSPWRWAAVLYPVLTTLVVVVTANHFWLDAIVAAAVLAVVLVIQSAGRRLRAADAGTAVAEPITQAAGSRGLSLARPHRRLLQARG